MQYVWHKGDTIYAGALFAAATYAFDVSALPALEAQGNQPADEHARRVGAGRLLDVEGRHGLRHLHGRPRGARPVHLRQRADRGGQRFRGLARCVACGSTETARCCRRRRRRHRRATTRSCARTCRRLGTPTVREPARHPGPRGPEHRSSPVTTPNRATSSSTRSRRPRRTCAARRSARGTSPTATPRSSRRCRYLQNGPRSDPADPLHAGEPRGHGDDGDEPAGAQGRVRPDHAGRRGALHAGHHGRSSRTGTRCSTTVSAGKAIHAGQRFERWRFERWLDPDLARTTSTCTARSPDGARARSARTTPAPPVACTC